MEKGKVWVLIGSIVFLSSSFFFVWVWKRSLGFGVVLKTYVWVLVSLLSLALIVGLVIWALIKRKKNMVIVNRNAIMSSCMECRSNHKQIIAFKGDADVGLEPRKVGHVIGYCRVKTEPIYKSVKKGKKISKKEIYGSQNLTFIAYRRMKGFIGSVIEPVKIIGLLSHVKDGKGRTIQDSDHTSLNGEKIYLNDATFMPKRFGLLFLSRHYKKTWMIDECVKQSISRYLTEEGLTQSQELIDAGFAISEKYKKERETSRANEVLALKEDSKK